MTRLRGRHVVVTGAARGIGKAIAERLVSEEATVSLLDLDEAVAGVGAALGAHAERCDVRDRAQVDAAVAEATGGTREQARELAIRDVPLGRMNEPAEIAGTVAWLLSPDARGVTGQAIAQNGGAWMG